MARNVGVYRKQGGHELVVASTTGGALQNGKVTVENNGEVELKSGAFIDVLSGGWMQLPRIARSTTDTAALPKQCIAMVTGSSTSPNFALPAPLGAYLYIKAVGVGSGGDFTISSSAHINNGKNRLKFDAIDEAVTLAGTSTGWSVFGNVGSVASTSG